MSWLKQLLVATVVSGLGTIASTGQTYLSEVLFAPPGSDIPNQYIELRGIPNSTLPAGIYVVTVDGDAADNRGVIQNVFDVSGRTFGGNGFLVLLQKAHGYTVSTNANVLVNTGSGDGFGSGATSSIGHQGYSGRTDLPHASVTFFLIQSTNLPAPGADIDGNNDGIPGGQMFRSWIILDSVGVADNAGDIAYGAINFRRNLGAIASGVVVPVSFTPVYIGRTGNTTNSQAVSWVASGTLGGLAPDWLLSTNRVAPLNFSGLALDHVGLPNFGAASLPGIVAIVPGGGMEVLEGGNASSYLLGLNTTPNGAVTIQINSVGQTQISIDGGTSFSNSETLSFTNSSLRAVTVRVLVDNVVENSPHESTIQHAVVDTQDAGSYPLTSPAPEIKVNILEQEHLLLNEIVVNPPGTNDAPCEFVEIKGRPNALLRNIYFLVIDGDNAGNPGQVDLVENLSGLTLGSNGLLAIGGDGNGYTVPGASTIRLDPRFNQPGGALNNGPMSFLVVSSPIPITEGIDLDADDDGIMEGLPKGTTILDAVGWNAGNTNDFVYGGVNLSESQVPPDASGRFQTNQVPQDASAWYFGELAGANCGALVFDAAHVSSNFPTGIILSPGSDNRAAVQIASVGPISGVIGDPTNPGLNFAVSAEGAPPDTLTASASSSNPEVVPDANLNIVARPGGQRTLYLNPVGVGYAMITLTVASATGVGKVAFPYAASAMGRPGGIWHYGTSDGSTAITIDPKLMFVGDNENNIIRLYERGRSGSPAREFNFQSSLGISLQERGEVNIEASTRTGNRIYFCGAHANSNLAETRTNRNRIFAAELSGTGTNSALTYVNRYEHLKTDLLNWDLNNGHGKGSNYYGFAASAADAVNPKAPDGFNIEGLSMAPGSTNAAWIGFRAPIVPVTNRTYTLIVPVLNFASLASNGGTPGSAIFGAPIELDLYGRGIRSMEGTTNGFILCAGPPGDVQTYPNDFKLYTWTGNPDDQPQQRAADLTGLLPEGMAELPILPWTQETQIQLISDNGTAVLYDDGVRNKHLPIPAFKKFRSDWVTLGPVVKPIPIIVDCSATVTSVVITWRALKGETYRVQSKAALSDPWADTTSDILATGPFQTASVPRKADKAFYRLQCM